MGFSAVIRRPDKGPLGSVDEVRRELYRAFPGAQFTLIEREAPPVAQVRLSLSPFLRLWFALFGGRVRYPHYSGGYEDKSGFAVEFYFEAEALSGLLYTVSPRRLI
jgi:hypothetical protein